MLPSISFSPIRTLALAFAACLISFPAQAQTPLPYLADPNLQSCLTEQAGLNGWQSAEQVVKLVCPGRGIISLNGMEKLPSLGELDLSNNQIVDVWSLFPLRGLTRLNLSGNRGLTIMAIRPVLDQNWGLTSLGLNGIEVGAFQNLGALFNPQTGRPYDLVELDLGNTKLNDANGGKSLDFLLPFLNLSRLNVAGNGIANINALSNFARLSELDLSNNAIMDVVPLFPLRALTRFNLSGNRSLSIMAIRPILDQNFGLISLGLNGIEVGSFSNLGPLYNPQTGQHDMAELDLGNTKLSDLGGGKSLDFLIAFSNLKRLNVANNGINNINALSNLSKLTELDLSNNAIADVGSLFPLRGLTRFNLSGNRGLHIMAIRPILDQSWNLTSLGLNGIEVGGFHNLGALFNPQSGRPYDLVELDLGDTKLSNGNGGKNLDFLFPFLNLSRLNVAGNGIDNINALTGFTRLTELDLSNNAIGDVGSLFPLRGLTRINLSGNRALTLVAIRPLLVQNWGLTSLGLNGIEVGAFNNLGALSNPQTGRPYDLVELDLGNTKLSDANGGKSLDFLLPFLNMSRLNVAGNGINNINALFNLSKLTELDLSNNAITDVVGALSPLRGLTRLNLSGNRGLNIMQLRPILDQNWGLSSLGLNGIEIGSFSNLGLLYSPQTGRPYDLVELDLGNANLSDLYGGKSLDFLLPFLNLSRLNVAGNGVTNINALTNFSKLTDLDLSNNQIMDVALYSLRGLTRLNLSGNRGLNIMQIRPLIDQNWGLSSLGLNGIEIGSFSNLGPLFNPQTGRPYDLVELDLGNTKLRDTNGGNALDFLSPFPGLSRLNVAGNGIVYINILGSFGKLTELDLSNNQIVDVGPLFPLYTLNTLNLLNNTQIRCLDLDALASALRFTVIQRPTPCVSNNLSPVATAGPAQTVNEGSAVTLAGNGSDSDGSIVSYSWVQSSGPQVVLTNANTAVARFTAPQVAADSPLSFKLVVTDNGGATGTASTNVTVKNIVVGPDLVVTAVSSPVTTVKRGSSFQVSSTTKNAGNGATNTWTTTQLYLSTDAIITTGDTSIRTLTIPSLGAGASMNANVLVTVPKTLAVGTYYIGAIADLTKRQTELNEANNSFAGVTINVTP